MKSATKMLFKIGGLGIVGILVVIQFIPYGHNHSNPPVALEPVWNSPQTRTLAKQACFDCHSHETIWPWYSHVAPVSWLVQNDVEEGRRKLNFSDWGKGRDGEEAEELSENIRQGKMPLRMYVLAHPETRLTDSQRRQLLNGLLATSAKRRIPPEAYQPHEHDAK